MTVALLCVAALQLANTVRSAQYNEQVLRGSLYLLADQVRHGPNNLEQLESLFDVSLKKLSYSASNLSRYQIQRLQQQHSVIDITNEGRTVRIMHGLDEQNLLEVLASNVTEQQAQATIYLLLEEWQLSGLSLDQFINKMQPHFGFPISTLPSSQLVLSEPERARLKYGEALVRFSVEEQEAEALISVPGQQQVLRLGPIRAFNPYSWGVISSIAVIAIMLIGLGVFWVVNSFEIRLHKLERATSRLAQGQLSARVAIKGQDPVARLGLSFNQMAEHIQRLISIQREMVRAVSHELRTPVARLRFGLQIVEDSIDDEYSLKQLAGLDADIQELDELIDEILTYARLEEGGPILDFQRENIAELAQRVVQEARLPEHVQVIYAGEAPEQSMSADVEPRYIHRAIQNLVSNAGRYAKSQVRVVCSVGNDTCRVDVEDDGPGIAKEQWDKVFTAFARLDDSRTRQSGGYGLGLSIVRRIAYWHGGHASVCRSEQLGGARFSIVWPRRQPDI